MTQQVQFLDDLLASEKTSLGWVDNKVRKNIPKIQGEERKSNNEDS